MKKQIVFFILFLSLIICLSVNRHIRSQPFTYHSEIWSDKAGYYIYLPALFIYSNEKFPDDISDKTGGAFTFKNQAFITKFPCGTAIMQLPFWVVAHLLSPEKDGFSFFYRMSINIAAAFYLCAGLMLCYFVFRKFLSTFYSILLCAMMMLGTNLFYYGIFETGMSHVYSFAIISILFYMIVCKWTDKTSFTIRDYIILGFLLGMIFLIRHINLILIPPLLAVGTTSWQALKTRFIQFFLSKRSIFFYITFLLTLIPLCIYKYYLHIHASSASYGNETFDYLFQPRILEVLFAPRNGALLLSPFLLIPIYFLFKSYTTNRWTFWAIISCFSLITYAYASWWSYGLGCGFGHRGFIEFYPFLFLPMAFFYQKKKFPIILILFFILCAVYTTKNAYSYDGCFTGTGDWDFKAHITLIRSNYK